MNLLDALKPLLWVSRIVGIAPYRLHKNGFRKSRSAIVYSWSLFLVNFILQNNFLLNQLKESLLSPKIIKSLFTSLDTLTLSLTSIICFFAVLARQKLTLKNILRLNEFCIKTNFLSNSQLREIRRLTYVIFLIVIPFSTILTVFDSFICFKKNCQSSLGKIDFFIMLSYCRLLICHIICCQFLIYFNLVNSLYKSIQKKLFNFKFRSTGKNSDLFTSQTHLIKGIRFLRKSHAFIKDVSEDWFTPYSIYGFFISSVVLFELVDLMVYYVKLDMPFFELCFVFLWIFYFVSQFLAIIFLCNAIDHQVKDFKTTFLL